MCCRCWYAHVLLALSLRPYVTLSLFLLSLSCLSVFWFLILLLSCRMMLTKDKKPELKDGGKETKDVVPPQQDTPKMFRAALKVTEQAGIEGTFAKLRKTFKQADGSQVRQ